ISYGDNTLYEYKSPNSYKNYSLDLKIIRKNEKKDIFFHIHRGNLKIVYLKKGNLIYSTGTEELEIQFQILESIIEIIIKNFSETYAVDAILSYGDVSPSIFNPFKTNVTEILNKFFTLDQVKKVDVLCKVCEKPLPLYVRKSLIDTADSYPVPLVYTHQGHSIVCYIDKKFDVRGVELVHITG
ncbi:MAG: hypothetical protein ACFFBP_08625, partial [Promethearchaeota archaeon]